MFILPRCILAASAVVVCLSIPVQAGYYTPIQFVEPDHWVVGDEGSTHQIWNEHDFSLDTTQRPDAWLTNPALVTEPGLTLSPPGFGPGAGRTYSFTGNYDLRATISNPLAIAPDPGMGTHVIVQTSTTTNESVGVIADTLRLLDSSDVVIAGGSFAEAVRMDVISDEVAIGPFGPMTVQQLIFEFYLPNYTDDFQITWTQNIHTGFDALRVDTMGHTEAYSATVIPEPTSLALLMMTGCGMLLLRRRRCGTEMSAGAAYTGRK